MTSGKVGKDVRALPKVKADDVTQVGTWPKYRDCCG